MEEVEVPVRNGYYNLLNGIVVDGKIIPVFDMEAPNPAQTPYIIIDSILPVSYNTKDSFGYEVTVDLLVYTTYKGDFGGRKSAGLIANKILNMVIPSPGRSGVSADGFNVYMGKMVGSVNEMSYSDTKRTYRKRITIEHLIEQL